MASPLLLSGRDVSRAIYEELANRIDGLRARNIVPGLAVCLVGEDPASQVYVRSKERRFSKLGLFSDTFRFPQDTHQEEIIGKIRDLNRDNRYHGILVQLPLPDHLNSDRILDEVSPKKDVDGFHPVNLGRLVMGRPRFVPCTPKGIMRILSHYDIDLTGKHVVVVGRSNIVGRPMSILTSLKRKMSNATTTLCHSRTADISKFTSQADVIIAAIGKPNYIRSDMVKQGVVVVDVGMNRVEDPESDKGYRLVGDVDFDGVSAKAEAITPVPGGVGPMTIAMLVENTVEAAENSVTAAT